MKLFGFTLAECLITLAIIGVVAALIVPAATNLRPNENKVMCLKAYDTLSETVASIASNTKLYPLCRRFSDSEIANCKDYPLFNLSIPLDSRFNNASYSGDRKLCNLLAFAIGADSRSATCSSNPYVFNAATFNNDFNDKISFVSKNGMQWMVVPAVASSRTKLDDSIYRGTFQTDVYVDINGSKGPNCIYSEECTKPDRFKFIVNANGKIDVADSLARRYIQTRKNFSKGKENDIAVNIMTNGSHRPFTYELCNSAASEPITPGGGGVEPSATIVFRHYGTSKRYLTGYSGGPCTIDLYTLDTFQSGTTINNKTQYDSMLQQYNEGLASCKSPIIKPTLDTAKVEISIYNGPISTPVIIYKPNGTKLLECSSGTCTRDLMEENPMIGQDNITVTSGVTYKMQSK